MQRFEPGAAGLEARTLPSVQAIATLIINIIVTLYKGLWLDHMPCNQQVAGLHPASYSFFFFHYLLHQLGVLHCAPL